MENNIKIDYLIALCHTITYSYSDLMRDIAKECDCNCEFDIELYKTRNCNHKKTEETLDSLKRLFENIDKYYQNRNKAPDLNLSKHSKDIQEFYLKYKDVFDIIERITNGKLEEFMSPIFNVFKYCGRNNAVADHYYEPYRKSIDTFIYFYKYIFSHQNNLDKILAVLNRIQQLGFDKLEFKDIDFTKERTYVNSNFSTLSSIVYLNNIIVLPTNNSDCIISTTGSNYMIKMPILSDKEEYNDTIVKTSCNIIVNSLIFDANTLPQKITKENTFYKIVNFYNEKKEDINNIKKLTDLYTCIYEYTNSSIKNLDPLDKKINQLDDIEIKNKLLELLSRIKIDLNELKNAYFKIENDVAEKNSISSEIVSLLNEMAIEEKKEEISHSYQKRHYGPQRRIFR